METRLDTRHALVCGASGGIGRASALALAELGCRVTALARREDVLAALIAELGEGADYLVADLDDRDSAIARVRELVAKDPVHILINNTGGPPAGPVLEATAADFERAIGRHLLAGHALLQAVLPAMRTAGYGRVINVVSTSVREPIPNLGVSNTTRGAVASWAKSVSHELPSGITINNVLPGSIDTPRLRSLAAGQADQRGVQTTDVLEEWRQRIPEGRIGEPREIAEVIAFLATPAAGYVRGQSIAVDGGRTRSI